MPVADVNPLYVIKLIVHRPAASSLLYGTAITLRERKRELKMYLTPTEAACMLWMHALLAPLAVLYNKVR